MDPLYEPYSSECFRSGLANFLRVGSYDAPAADLHRP